MRVGYMIRDCQVSFRLARDLKEQITALYEEHLWSTLFHDEFLPVSREMFSDIERMVDEHIKSLFYEL